MEFNQISDDLARRFATTLCEVERSGRVEELVELFASDATVQRIDARGERTGEVAQFWHEYLDQFDEVRTRFTDAVEGHQGCALEWTSAGRLSGGREIEYRGVTLLRFDGERISGLRTYYDSARFVLAPADSVG